MMGQSWIARYEVSGQQTSDFAAFETGQGACQGHSEWLADKSQPVLHVARLIDQVRHQDGFFRGSGHEQVLSDPLDQRLLGTLPQQDRRHVPVQRAVDHCQTGETLSEQRAQPAEFTEQSVPYDPWWRGVNAGQREFTPDQRPRVQVPAVRLLHNTRGVGPELVGVQQRLLLAHGLHHFLHREHWHFDQVYTRMVYRAERLPQHVFSHQRRRREDEGQADRQVHRKAQTVDQKRCQQMQVVDGDHQRQTTGGHQRPDPDEVFARTARVGQQFPGRRLRIGRQHPHQLMQKCRLQQFRLHHSLHLNHLPVALRHELLNQFTVSTVMESTQEHQLRHGSGKLQHALELLPNLLALEVHHARCWNLHLDGVQLNPEFLGVDTDQSGGSDPSALKRPQVDPRQGRFDLLADGPLLAVQPRPEGVGAQVFQTAQRQATPE